MPILHVRNVPEDLHEELQRLAERKHRSLSAEVVALLEQAVEAEGVREAQAQVLASVRRRRSQTSTSAGVDSVSLLREDRDE
jgi:plasmid stability protein